MVKNFSIKRTLSAIGIGVAGGVFAAAVFASSPAPVTSATYVAPEPAFTQPSTPILLLNNGEAHASVQVNRNGLILLNLRTRTGQSQIALGVLGDSKLEVGVFDSVGKAKAGMEVPLKDSGKVQMLLFDRKDQPAKSPARS